MKWSFRVVTIAGIEVRIHGTFLLLLAFFAWMYYQSGGPEAAIFGVVFTLLLFFCVLLHEFGHAFAARAFGIRTPDITLLPIGGLARLERMPSSPWQELVIAIAGPMVNVVIALVLWVFLGAFVSPGRIFGMDSAASSLLPQLLKINIVLVLFNIIPAFPMDGGRILRALLAMWLPHAKATMIAGRIGQVFAVLMGIYGYLTGQYMLIFIAFFVFSGAQQEVAYSSMRAAAKSLLVGQAMQYHFKTAPQTLRVGEIAALLIHSNQNIFTLVDESLHYHGMATRDELAAAARTLPKEAFANSVARKLPAVHPETPFNEAIELMNRISEPVLPVINHTGQIVGLFDLNYLNAVSKGVAPKV